jgi:hypothetical protein
MIFIPVVRFSVTSRKLAIFKLASIVIFKPWLLNNAHKSFFISSIWRTWCNKFGLYRDDGLGIIKATPRQIEQVKKDLCALLNNHGLKITIEANKKIVNFLDVTLNLTTGKYNPYSKPNNTPLYVHSKSNHPPSVLRNIPLSTNKRITEISSDQDSFEQASPSYQLSCVIVHSVICAITQLT